jgi:hypothetical protein
MGIAYFSVYPAGFYITAFAFGFYLLARLVVALRSRRLRAGARGAPAPAVGTV